MSEPGRSSLKHHAAQSTNLAGIVLVTETEVLLRGLSIDVCFSKPGAGGLDYGERLRTQALLDHLAHAVARRPADLMVHVRRIRLAAALEHEAPLAEALADLFIVLGEKGKDLRTRALRDWGAGLSQPSREILERALADGTDGLAPLPFRCRLSGGTAGRRGWVEPYEAPADATGVPARAERVPLDTALDLIDSGQLDDACTLLETWLPQAEDEMWREAAPELARLYRYLDNGEQRARAWSSALRNASEDRARAWAALTGNGGNA